nr:uncharacterized mitochondrial protein AtMg00810-like [Tanacetum cinerariifolium]
YGNVIDVYIPLKKSKVVLDDSSLTERDFSFSLMGKIKDINAMPNLYLILANEGFENDNLSYLGEFNVVKEDIISSDEESEGDYAENKSGNFDLDNEEELDHVFDSSCMRDKGTPSNSNEHPNQSKDPSEIYKILKRNKELEINSEKNSQPKNISVDNNEGVTSDLIGSPIVSMFKASGSILDVMDELIKELNTKHRINFVAIKETKMANIDLFSIKALWGNLCFDYALCPSIGYSGGMWVPSSTKLFIIFVDAPQEFSDRKMLWDYIYHLMILGMMSRDDLTVGSTMRIPLLYRGEYSQWVERFMNYLEEQTDGKAMINSIKNGDQPLPRVTQVSIARTSSNEQPPMKDKSMWSDQEKKIQKIDRLARSLQIQGLSNDIYSLIDSNKTAKDLWDALARHMLGSEYGEQDRKAAVLYEYETFKATEGELLLDTYIHYLQVINDLKKYGYSKDNYDFSELKKITALLAKAFNRRKFYSKPTNNNLRSSSTSQSANKKQEFLKTDNKKVEKKDDEKKRDMSRVKLINANMVFMAQIEKVLSDSEASSSSADEKISEDNLYNGRKGIGFENPSYFEKAKDLRTTLYDEKFIGLGYTLMFLTNSNEALEIEKFKRSRENKIEFAYDYENLNASYQTSSLKPYVLNVILEKIIIDLEDEVVNILEKEKQTWKQLKCDKVENPNVITPGMFKLSMSQCVSPILMKKSSCDSNNVENLDTFSSVRRPKHSGVIWKKKWSSNTSNADLSSVSHLKLNKDVKRYSRKDLLSCNNSHLGETSIAFVCNDAMNVSCNSSMGDLLDDNNFFIFDDKSVRISPVSKMPFRKKPCDSMIMRSKSNMNKYLPRTVHKWLPKMQPLVEPVAKWIPRVEHCLDLSLDHRFGMFKAYDRDVVIGSMKIKKVYYVEGLGHNLFSVGQFCDKGLEVAFRNSTCFVRNEDGVDLLTGDRSSNLYTIALNEVASKFSTCLIAKASSSQSWLWHQQMASKQFSLEPGLSNLNKTGKSSNLSVSQVSEASRKDFQDLFHNFYDEYFDSSKIMKSSTTNVETSINEEVFHEVSESFQGESSSSSLNDDVQQSPEEVILPQKNTQSISNNMVPNVDEASTSHNVFNECLKDAYFDAILTPMVEQAKLKLDLVGKPVDHTDYRSMIGSLMCATSSRPDIMFAICMCARYQANPNEHHVSAVKRIFRYLKGTINLGLWCPKDFGFDLTTYSDADHAGCHLD